MQVSLPPSAFAYTSRLCHNPYGDQNQEQISMVNQNLTATEIGFTHEDFAALLDKYDYHFSPGDIVPGTVFSIEPRGALIDIGAKTAAYIPIQEMSINRVDAPEEVLQ